MCVYNNKYIYLCIDCFNGVWIERERERDRERGREMKKSAGGWERERCLNMEGEAFCDIHV